MTKDYSQIYCDPDSSLRQIALLTGYHRLNQMQASQVSSYQELLDDEWEGLDSAHSYIEKSSAILQMMQKRGDSLQDSLQNQIELENVGVTSFWKGLSTHLKQEISLVSYLSDKIEQSTLEAEPRLLGNLLREMAYAIQEATDDFKQLRCDLLLKPMTDTQNDQYHCSLNTAKKYLFFQLLPSTISKTDQPQEAQLSKAEWTDALTLLSQTTEKNWTANLPCDLTNAVLTWCGGAELMHGTLLLSPEGLERGIILLIPEMETTENDNLLRARQVNGRNETILLVDDEDMIWDVVFSMLQELGYTVILAENGQDAVDIYQANPNTIDLVLLDMLMPVLNGREAFHQLKKLSPDVKVLLASGYVNEEDVADVLQNGAAGFLRKPYRLQDLAKKIRDILDN